MSTLPFHSAETLTRSFIDALMGKPEQDRLDELRGLIDRVRNRKLDCPYIGPFQVMLNLARASGIEIPDEEDLVAQEVEKSLQRFFGNDANMRRIIAFCDLSWEKRQVGNTDTVLRIRLPNYMRLSDPQTLDFLYRFLQAIDWSLVIQVGEIEVFAKPEISKAVLRTLLTIES